MMGDFMIIKEKDLVDTIYSVLNNHDEFSITVEDFMMYIEAISNIFNEYHFQTESKTMPITMLTENEYVKAVDEEGEIHFSVPKRKRKRIFEKNKELASSFDKILIACEFASELYEGTNNLAIVDIANPDDEYELDYEFAGTKAAESRLFTDGDVSLDEENSTDEYLSASKTASVTDSTFVITAYYTGSKVQNLNIRTKIYDTDYMLERVNSITNGVLLDYDVSPDRPYVYTLKKM